MLRLRLGVLVTTALLVALGASALLSVTLFERHQLAEMSARLERELDRVLTLMANPEVGETLLEAGTERLVLQLVDSSGQVVVPVGASESLPVSDKPSWVEWQGNLLVVASAPWTLGSGMVVGTVRLGYDAAEAVATRAALRNSLLWAAVIIAALSGLVALLLLGRQLRPLARLADEAAALDPSDPQLDLPPLRDDEVGRVGIALERAVAAIRERHRSEREALAGIAHELAAPLTVVAGQLEALAHEDDSPQLHAARDAARELLHTSQDLLTLARGELKLPLEMSVVSLAQVAARVSAEYEGVQVETTGEALVIASPERLAQIVRNLVRNAVQTAGTPGGVRVKVTSDAQHAIMEVSDDGPGLNPGALAHLFERHYTQRDNQGGSGIGLSIVHDLVRAHGGTVVALAGPGGGALFRVRLPALGAQLEDG